VFLLWYSGAMPELPEVETTTRGLQSTVKGQKITGIWTDWEKMFRGTTSSKLSKEIIGTQFTSFERRGKNILAHLSNGYTLIMHMKMTGHFMYGEYVYHKKENAWKPKDSTSPLADPFNRFIHVVFSLSDGKHLVFCDARKFGKIELIKTSDIFGHVRVGTLGPEPLESDFTYEAFAERLHRKRRSKIKPSLLDQTIIAGIGNIYSDESLFRSGIHPETIIEDISKPKLKNLHTNIQAVLEYGIDFGGDSTSDYRNIHGEHGGFHETHKVYRRAGKTCTKRGCKGIIERTVVATRGTYICPHCQKKN
jgi:formamidopyrimidine-DNA glycosylase